MKKSIFLAVISGLLLTLSFSRYNFWILAWFGFVPVFLALDKKSNKQAFLLLFITGVVFWAGTIYWLVHVTLPGTAILVLYLALYFGLFGLIFSSFVVRRSSFVVFFIPAVWVLLEYMRSHLFTGFPWALLGYSQYLNLPVIQIADITGVWGISFLIVFVNTAITEIIWARKSRLQSRLKATFVLLLLFLSLTLSYGYYGINERRATSDERRIRVSVIQGNIPQELKWDPSPQAKYFIIDRYLELTSEALKDNPDLVIWPEASLPVVAEEEPEFLGIVKEFARERKLDILLGAVTTRNNLYYNSAVLVSKTGESTQQYNKLHLVPFGEYIPLKKALPFLQAVVPIGEMAPGKEYTVFNLSSKLQAPSSKLFGVLICFEDLFPEISRRFVKNGAGFLVNITNDAWYKDTSAPYQHLQASVFRAVENRVYLARAANTGISGFINPQGKIVSLLKDASGRQVFVEGFDNYEISERGGIFSFYTRYGDLFILFCFISCLLFIFRPINKPAN